MKNRLLKIFILTITLTLTFADLAYAVEVQSRAAIVMDAQTGIVLFEYGKDDRIFPASVTKVMTALLVIENSGGLFDGLVDFSQEAIDSIGTGSSNIKMKQGESLTLDDALYGLMLASANEVSNALAETIAGDVNSFARWMTARAHRLGATGTNFTNAHGLPENEHYTTAYDTALIMREAIKHPKFIELISAQTHSIIPTENFNDTRNLTNTNRMIQPGTNFFDERVVGGKTGYTNAARHTLVTYGSKDGIELIIAAMGAESGQQYADTTALLDYGFLQYEELEIFNPIGFEEHVPVIQAVDTNRAALGTVAVATVMEKPLARFLPRQAAQYIRTEIDLPARVVAPITGGDTLGELRIYCNDALLETIPLVALEDIARLEPMPEPPPQTSAERLNSEIMVLALFAGLATLGLAVLSNLMALRSAPRNRYKNRYL